MDKLTALKTFALAAKTENFAEAARQLGLSRSQVNKHVIWLEDHLSVTLFNRTTRKINLTSTGRAYLERIRIILADLQEVEQQLQSDQVAPAGDLRINAPMSFGTMHLSQAVVDFMQLYPDIQVQLHLSDEKLDPVSHEFDMTVRIATPQNNITMIEHHIADIRRVMCVAPSFIEKYGEPQSLAQLHQLPCLHYGNLPSGSAWILTQGKQQHRVQVNGILCSNNAEVLRDAAIAGLGVALLPTFIIGKELQEGKLIRILHPYASPELALTLVYPPNRHLSQRTRLFVKYIQARYAEQRGWDMR